jgi:prevent-host-death family protein
MTMKSARRKRNNPGAAIRPTKTVSIPAGQFKARCLALMDRVRDGREEYIITKHGKAVARLVPIEDEPADIFGYMRNTVINYTDVITPLDEVWEAEKG